MAGISAERFEVNEAVVRGADAYTFRPVSIGELKAAMERAFQAHKPTVCYEVKMASKSSKRKTTRKSPKLTRAARQTRIMRIVFIAISIILILSWVLSLVK
jgi:DNA-binding NarL/FixJ family response regulator